MDGGSVREAVDAMLEVLTPHAGSNWTVSAGPVEWSCRHTAAHVAHDLMAYAGQVAARPVGGYLPMDLTVRSDASVSDLLASVPACGALLPGAISTSEPEAVAWVRGWYGRWGRSDDSVPTARSRA